MHVIREKIRKVLYVGGVIEEKGCLDIFEVAKHCPDIEFTLIGKSNLICIKESKKYKNVILAGTMKHDDIIKEMKEADVFMFLSYFRGEGFSNALVEAMAAGLPCIVSDWAANSDMIENKGGVVVPIKKPIYVLEALKKMVSKNIRESYSKFNINKVKNCYSEQVVISQYVECYNGNI